LLGNKGRAFVQYRTREERAQFDATAAEIPALANELSAKHVIVAMALGGLATVVDSDRQPTIVEFGREEIRVHPDLVDVLRGAPIGGPIGVFPSPPVRHPGQDLIDRALTSVDDARTLAEYIRLERKYGSIGDRYPSVRALLLEQFPNDTWLHEQLAEDDH
jgi:hypothetical protein